MSQTALEKQLAGEPADAVKAARRRFLRKERVDMSELATELGVGRATLYRWVGSREQLLGEVLWTLSEPGLAKLRAEAKGTGAESFLWSDLITGEVQPDLSKCSEAARALLT